MARRLKAIAAAVMAVSSFFYPWGAEAIPIVAGPQATTTGYATVAVPMTQGEEITFYNFDIDSHDIRSDDVREYEIHEDGSITGDYAPWCPLFQFGNGPGIYRTCPLFFAELVGLSDSSVVQGSADLPPGSYNFYCGPHSWMTGTLVVLENPS